ncbi:hypothetical protein SXM_0312 [Shewanella xiamenensis]|nr:hypothetical protein SXM_0312 [Shewanella xiamenensis]
MPSNKAPIQVYWQNEMEMLFIIVVYATVQPDVYLSLECKMVA